MKAVVFGGSGFLGSHVADALSEKGYIVTIFDKAVSKYLKDGQSMIIGDILDKDQVSEAVQGCSYAYDYAGMANLNDASAKPLDTVMLNVAGTCNILDACVERGVKRFIYASSFYANSDKGGFYRCSKQAAEIYIEEYGRKYGLEYTILRYGSLYGPRSDVGNGMREMIQKAMAGGVIHCSGSADDVREYIHVADAAELSVEILEEKYANRHIQLTGQEAYRRDQVMAIVGEILGKNLEVIYDGETEELHYKVTPYAYKPQSNYKLVSNCYHDLGQGIIEVMELLEAESSGEERGNL